MRGEPAKTPSAGGAVTTFVLASLAAVLVFFVGTLFVLRQLGRREAVRDAREFAQLAGQGIVEPRITSGVLAGRPTAVVRLDRLAQERVLSQRMVRVKIWTRGGRMVYSWKASIDRLSPPTVTGRGTVWQRCLSRPIPLVFASRLMLMPSRGVQRVGCT